LTTRIHHQAREDHALNLLRSGRNQLATAANEGDLLQDLCTAAVREPGYVMAWIGLRRPDGTDPVQLAARAATAELGGSHADAEPPPGLANATDILDAGRLQVIRRSGAEGASPPTSAAAPPCRATAWLPLRHEGQTFGFLALCAAEATAFEPEELDLLQELAGQLSARIMALRSEGTLAGPGDKLTRVQQQQDALRALLNVALESRPLADKLQTSLHHLTTLPCLPATQGAAIFLRDSRADTLTLAASLEMPREILTTCASVPLDSCVCGRVGRCGEPLHDTPAEPARDHRLSHPPERSRLALPLPGSKPFPLGVLLLYMDPDHHCSEEEHLFLATAAAMIGNLVEQDQARQSLTEIRNEHRRVRRLLTLGELASSLAHQLNQPLTAAANYNALAETKLTGGEPASAAINELLEYSNSEIQRASAIVRNIRSFLGFGQPDFRYRDINDALLELQPMADEILKQVGPYHLALDLAPDPPPVPFDEVLVQEALLNLIRNGGEAMAEAGRAAGTVTVASRWTAEGAEVMVRDEGPGLSEEQRTQLVQPFTSSKVEGMGLGLAVCQSVAEMHDGLLWAEEPGEAGAGAEIHLRLSWGSKRSAEEGRA